MVEQLGSSGMTPCRIKSWGWADEANETFVESRKVSSLYLDMLFHPVLDQLAINKIYMSRQNRWL